MGVGGGRGVAGGTTTSTPSAPRGSPECLMLFNLQKFSRPISNGVAPPPSPRAANAVRRPDWLTFEPNLVEYLLTREGFTQTEADWFAAPPSAAAASGSAPAQPPEGGKGPVSGRGRRRGGSGGRAVSRMEGINHYWRTPSSPTHPDGPSTPDINHHSPTIDPLALPRREKCAGRIDCSLFSLAPPPPPTPPPPPPPPADRTAVSL